MGVPTSEVSYSSAMPRREDHEVHKHVGALEKKNKIALPRYPTEYVFCIILYIWGRKYDQLPDSSSFVPLVN